MVDAADVGAIMDRLRERGVIMRDLPHAVVPTVDVVGPESFAWCMDNLGWILDHWAPPDVHGWAGEQRVWRFASAADAAWFAMVWA